MTAQVDIYNFALGNIGSSDTVADLEERSKQANVCNRFYPLARDSMLADFEWPFATRYETLAPLPTTADGWAYAYQYPSDCVRVLYLGAPGALSLPSDYQQRFEVGYGDGGQVILSDVEQARLAYISRVEDTGRFPALFVEALSWKLAAMIAMPLTNTRTITETAMQMAEQATQKAWAAALNQSSRTTDVLDEYTAARGAGMCYHEPWRYR